MKRGRPSLGLNETGQMWVVRNDNGTWTAKQWLRGTDGRRRQVTASGRTRREATDKLTAKLAIRPTANARGIQPDWTITELGTYWLDRKARVERTKTGAPSSPRPSATTTPTCATSSSPTSGRYDSTRSTRHCSRRSLPR